MPTDIDRKREHEKRIVEVMIGIYCHGIHRRKKGTLCPECETLKDYAHARSEKCPFMATKTFCANCKVHCYKPEMREKIRTVMRYAGPRMILHYPLETIRHGMESRGKTKKSSKNL